jgi:hypothetical protein
MKNPLFTYGSHDNVQNKKMYKKRETKQFIQLLMIYY